MFPSSFLGGCIEHRVLVLVASYKTLAGLINVTTDSLAVGDPFAQQNSVCTGSHFT